MSQFKRISDAGRLKEINSKSNIDLPLRSSKKVPEAIEEPDPFDFAKQ